MTSHPVNPGTGASTEVTRRARHAFELVDEWMFSEPMAHMLELFGGRLPDRSASSIDDPGSWLHPTERLPRRLVRALEGGNIEGLTSAQLGTLRGTLALERRAAADFDFRTGSQYRERSQATVADFDAELRERVVAPARGLGLVRARPTRLDQYDRTLVLGGGYQTPLRRARHCADLRKRGVALGELGFLGSPRFLIDEPAERPAVESYAPAADDEFDLMGAAAVYEFELVAADTEFLCGCASADEVCPVWRYRAEPVSKRTPPAFTHERRAFLADRHGDPVGFVVSASTSRPPFRPDTSDTFDVWARCAAPRPRERVLVVTTQVFVPFQTFEGLRRLYVPHGVELDTVGFGPEGEDCVQTAEYLLQETLSAIRSGRRLLVDAARILIGA